MERPFYKLDYQIWFTLRRGTAGRETKGHSHLTIGLCRIPFPAYSRMLLQA